MELGADEKITIKNDTDTISFELEGDGIKGAGGGTSGIYMISFVCNVCEAKTSKTFSKASYHKGVVLVKCDGCKN
jgi:hypothetical protein